MNVLTKNRILQNGDEYKDNGTWKPVPKDNFGLQVMFTDYKEVRRPSEEPPKNLRETPETAKDARTEVPERVVSPTPISPKQAAGKIATPVAAESEKVPVPTHSGTGNTLPTIISKKAHLGSPAGPIEKAIEKAKVIGASTGHIKISFPDGPESIWTGRNGTFTGYGLEAMIAAGNEIVMLSPIGKRGVGNCTIQFPVTIIPQLVDWLMRHQKTL